MPLCDVADFMGQDAERLLARALSADDRLLDVLVLAAALGSVQGNRTRILLMRKAAERLGMHDIFDDALNKILADIDAHRRT
jgi:hypothetical protein